MSWIVPMTRFDRRSYSADECGDATVPILLIGNAGFPEEGTAGLATVAHGGNEVRTGGLPPNRVTHGSIVLIAVIEGSGELAGDFGQLIAEELGERRVTVDDATVCVRHEYGVAHVVEKRPVFVLAGPRSAVHGQIIRRRRP